MAATRLRSRLLLAALVSAGALFVPRGAEASPLIEAFGAVGSNAGEQGVVAGPGPGSTYFNPALLLDAEDQFTLAFALISEQMGVSLEGRPSGANVPLIVGAGGVLAPNGQPLPAEVVPTQWLNHGGPNGFAARPRQAQGSSGVTRTYLAFGLSKAIIPKWFTIGLYGMLPISNFTTAQPFYPDEREALFSNSLHPELYGDRLTSVSIVIGAALKILPSLSVGAGLSIGLANTASSDDYVQSATNYSLLLLENKVATSVNIAPTLGVRFQPTPWLRIGGAVHAPESFTIDTAVQATLPTGSSSGTTQKNVFDWMPWSAALGVEAIVARRGAYTMSVVGSIDHAIWSQYVDRMGQSPSSYGPGLGFHDTTTATIGMRHTYKDARAFIDMRYVPSPVPAQVGNSNYVDNSRAGVGFGGDILIKLLKVRPGFQVFADRFIPRTNQKDDALITNDVPQGSTVAATGQPVTGLSGLQTNNPGWPGFSSSGWLWGGGVTLSMPL